MTTRMVIHDRDCAVTMNVTESTAACTCRERMRKKQAKRPKNTNGRPLFDGAIQLSPGCYWTRPLGSSDGD